MKEKIEFRKAREFGEIIGDTFLFIKQNFAPLMKAFFAMSGIFIVGGMVSAAMAQLQVVGISQTAGKAYNENLTTMFYNFGFNYVFVIIFMICSYTAMYVSVLSYVALYIQKGKQAPSVNEVWGYFKYYFFRVMGSGIVMSLFGVVCFICCLIPGIYVFPIITLFYAIMILENGTLGHSFNRSFKLIKDEWWMTAATMLVVYIIFYAFSMIVQLPSIIIMMVSAFTSGERTITSTYAIVSSISQYVSYIFMIIPIISSALIYYNLVERKENLGLFNRIDGFGQGPVQENPIQEEY